MKAIIASAVCVILRTGIAFADPVHLDPPYITHTKDEHGRSISKFCTTVKSLADDVNIDSKIKLILVGAFSDEQFCGTLPFPYVADDVAHWLVHKDIAASKLKGDKPDTIEILARQ